MSLPQLKKVSSSIRKKMKKSSQITISPVCCSLMMRSSWGSLTRSNCVLISRSTRLRTACKPCKWSRQSPKTTTRWSSLTSICLSWMGLKLATGSISTWARKTPYSMSWRAIIVTNLKGSSHLLNYKQIQLPKTTPSEIPVSLDWSREFSLLWALVKAIVITRALKMLSVAWIKLS